MAVPASGQPASKSAAECLLKLTSGHPQHAFSFIDMQMMHSNRHSLTIALL